MSIKVKSYFGTEANQFIDDLASLRMQVFREFPYLYEGSVENEARYLATFLQAADSIIVIAFDGDRVVGASTGMPLEQETEDIQQPWLEHGIDIQKVFYFSESVLLSEYRGKGIGVQFFEQREAWARKLGRFDLLTFCGVVRPEDHPLRPADFVPLDRFWQKRGFEKREDYVCHLSWVQVDGVEKVENALQFWGKEI